METFFLRCNFEISSPLEGEIHCWRSAALATLSTSRGITQPAGTTTLSNRTFPVETTDKPFIPDMKKNKRRGYIFFFKKFCWMLEMSLERSLNASDVQAGCLVPKFLKSQLYATDGRQPIGQNLPNKVKREKYELLRWTLLVIYIL